MIGKSLLNLTCLLLLWSVVEGFTSEEVKCHVCKATVQEMENAIAKEDPNKTADVSGFRLDAHGNSISKTVKLIKSEMYLTELMEKICDKMEDYVKATYKSNGKFTLLKMIVNDKMNPESSLVDFVQDGDLNKSLGHYCLEILDDQEIVFLKAFQAPTLADDLDSQICGAQAKYCSFMANDVEYNFDDKDEL
ncbi:PREDICTED: protein canopy homolog 2 [Rhagoletis zephyria]|uniref:protein canopy homolog 2 n=1 Tax=Rhagoletis zephyria TaxID=28612 RepID=UPI000811917A|nr:PREDICTED: protein canopy homolog 2 [Rhagoletis zephyria]XP_036331524.1 protein seele [Rhagoletis pomonella]